MRPLRPSGVAWTSWKPAELQTWVRIPARASLRRVLRATPTVHCGSDLRPSANFGSGFKPGSSHRSASMASPHPCLLVLALSVVVGLAIAPAMSNSATAIQSREDSPRQGTLPAEPHTSSASKLNSVAADRDLRIRPVQAGPSPSTPKAAIPVEGFEGLHFGTNGLYTNRLTPPDVQVAVGPNHVVEMVNVLGRISTKQGVEVRTFPLYSFFGVPSTDFISDPKIHFDSASNRWFASITDVTTGSVLLEVSKSDDPTGLWNAYRVSTITGCADQPLLGFSNLVVIISANDFSSCTGGNPSYLGVQYWVLNKTDLLSGATPRTMSFGPDPTLFSVHPVQSLRSTDTQFMVSTGSGPTSTLTLFSVTGVPPGVVLVTQQNFGPRPANRCQWELGRRLRLLIGERLSGIEGGHAVRARPTEHDRCLPSHSCRRGPGDERVPQQFRVPVRRLLRRISRSVGARHRLGRGGIWHVDRMGHVHRGDGGDRAVHRRLCGPGWRFRLPPAHLDVRRGRSDLSRRVDDDSCCLHCRCGDRVVRVRPPRRLRRERTVGDERIRFRGRDEVRILGVPLLPPILRLVRVPRYWWRLRVFGAFRNLRAIRTRSVGPREPNGLGGCGQRLRVPVISRRLERERALAGESAESERDRLRVGGHRGRVPSSSPPDVQIPGSRRVVDFSRFRLVRRRCLHHAIRQPRRRLGRGHMDGDWDRCLLRA